MLRRQVVALLEYHDVQWYLFIADQLGLLVHFVNFLKTNRHMHPCTLILALLRILGMVGVRNFKFGVSKQNANIRDNQ